MIKMMAGLWNEESGQGMAEYGLILALVAVAAIAAFNILGGRISSRIENVGNELYR